MVRWLTQILASTSARWPPVILTDDNAHFQEQEEVAGLHGTGELNFSSEPLLPLLCAHELCLPNSSSNIGPTCYDHMG